jgi:hypothetical protein
MAFSDRFRANCTGVKQRLRDREEKGVDVAKERVEIFSAIRMRKKIQHDLDNRGTRYSCFGNK